MSGDSKRKKLETILDKLRKLLPHLGNANVAEAEAARQAINRLLAKAKLDWHDLMARMLEKQRPFLMCWRSYSPRTKILSSSLALSVRHSFIIRLRLRLQTSLSMVTARPGCYPAPSSMTGFCSNFSMSWRKRRVSRRGRRQSGLFLRMRNSRVRSTKSFACGQV